MLEQSAREIELLEANNHYQQEARDARAALKGGFQDRVMPFMLACFGVEIAGDGIERNHRFLEESLELVQALGCTASEARQLVDYVFNRPVGEPHQEAGGVAVTFAALCNAHGINAAVAAENELTRCWSKIDKIRAKQAAKPKHGPLPETASSAGLFGLAGVVAMSADHESKRVLKLHYDHDVTDLDRVHLVDMHNQIALLSDQKTGRAAQATPEGVPCGGVSRQDQVVGEAGNA